MKYNINDIEKELLKESNDITPNVLEKVKNKSIGEEANDFAQDQSNKRFIFKGWKLALSVFLFVFVTLSISGGVVYGLEYETLTMEYQEIEDVEEDEINPSIEFTINRFDRVINVSYNNQDAEVFDDIAFNNKKTEDAILLCTNRLVEKSVIKKTNSKITLNGYGKNHQYDQKRLNVFTDLVNNECRKKKLDCEVESSIINEKERNEMKNNKVSYAKMDLINSILSATDEYSFDDLKIKTMKELKVIYKDLNKNNKK